MNHWPECIDIWQGGSLGRGDLRLSTGSCTAPPQGLKLLHTDIYGNAQNFFFSRTAAPNGTIFSMDHL